MIVVIDRSLDDLCMIVVISVRIVVLFIVSFIVSFIVCVYCMSMSLL